MRQHAGTAASAGWSRLALPLLLLACLLPNSIQPAAAAGPPGTPATAAAVIAAAPPDVPRLELQKWNQALKMYIPLITPQQQEEYQIVSLDKCSADGFNDIDASNVPLEACFYKQYANGSYAYWVKKPGDWRTNSNCYCYALNVYKGGFCIPGANNILSSSSASPSTTPTCEVIRAAALADGARLVPRHTALTTQPATGHYIGLLSRNSSCNPYHCWREDFHAIRKDATGLWSWKEPGGPASDVDLFGNKISDPQNARLPGNYDHWCGFFWVDPQNMTIGGNFREDYKVAAMADYYQQLLGAPVTLTPTPYNQTVDGAFDSWAAKGYAGDLAWEGKRGSRNWDAFYASGGAAAPGSPGAGLQGGPAAAAGVRNVGSVRNVGGSGRTNMGLPAQPRMNLPAVTSNMGIASGTGAVSSSGSPIVGKGSSSSSSSAAGAVSATAAAAGGRPSAAAAAAPISGSSSLPAGSSSLPAGSSSDLRFASVRSSSIRGGNATLPQVYSTSAAAGAASSSRSSSSIVGAGSRVGSRRLLAARQG